MNDNGMDDNDPYQRNDPGPETSRARRAVFTGMLLLLGLLVYLMVRHIQGLAPEKPQPTVSAPAPAARRLTLAFPVEGRVAQMFFPAQAHVNQGDILAALDKVPFEEARAAAQAQLDLAEAEYNKAAHAPSQNFDAIEGARATVETAQHSYQEAHAELVKRRRLIVAGQTDNVYDDDVQNERDAELNLERARRELGQQEAIGGNNGDLSAQKAAIVAAQAQLAIAQTNLEETQLAAPASGLIDSRAVEPGTSVAAGETVYILAVPLSAGAKP